MSVAENDLIARSLGPDAYDPPAVSVGPHPFRSVRISWALHGELLNQKVCSDCGGGILHEIHSVDAQEAA
jgi:hypothetical protein